MFDFWKKKGTKPAAFSVRACGDDEIVALAKGRMFPIDEVKDAVFSAKMMGDGVAFELGEDCVCAPANGEINMIFPTGHAFGMTTKEGVELLVHIGIETVALEGAGFKVLVKEGAQVKAGDPVVKVDRAWIKGQGVDLSTMLIVTDDNGKTITFRSYGDVELGVRIN